MWLASRSLESCYPEPTCWPQEQFVCSKKKKLLKNCPLRGSSLKKLSFTVCPVCRVSVLLVYPSIWPVFCEPLWVLLLGTGEREVGGSRPLRLQFKDSSVIPFDAGGDTGCCEKRKGASIQKIAFSVLDFPSSPFFTQWKLHAPLASSSSSTASAQS